MAVVLRHAHRDGDRRAGAAAGPGEGTIETSLSAALGLGFVLGLRHALDADHVAAVSVLVSRHRSLARACLQGTFWGAGHTASLLVASLLVIAFRLTIPSALERALETGVAALLVLLGLRALGGAVRGVRLHSHAHAHGECQHRHVHFHADVTTEHAGPHEHAHRGFARLAGQPFLIGMLHGLAGSAALMLLVLASIPSAAGGLLYIATFGLGSSAGMAVLSAAIGLPFALRDARWRVAGTGIQVLAGASSLGLGLWLLWGLGVA